MNKNQLQPVNGNTHIAITGTYNKVLGFVKFGEDMQKRIGVAICKNILKDRPAGTSVEIDYEKQVAIESRQESHYRYEHKHPFTLVQVTEF